MPRFLRIFLLFWALPLAVSAQVDTLYVHNTNLPYSLDIRIQKSPTRWYYLQEDTTFSFRESAPGVKTNTYRDMTSWDSSPYKQGNLREKNGSQDLFIMNYRLLHPMGYNATYSPGYPIIVMMHGAGERGNCWDTNCFFNTPSYNPNVNSPVAPTTVDHQLLNNDLNLVHGGSPHLTARNLAGTKLPDDPTLAARAFPGFVLFPQNLNGWSANPASDVIRIIRLLVKKYNIDQNRIYIHGLSNGGMGTYEVIKRAPWMFAAALPMSAIENGNIITHGMAEEVGKLPMWIFQGGQDTNPTPSQTFATIKNLRAAGANIRYSLYPNLGHGVWNTAYNEPDFFTWILAKRKYNPHIYFGNPVICGTNQTGVQIGFSDGFLAYQWERDGVIIPGETNSTFTADIPGTYRARFSRKSTSPSEAEWERWSDPIIVTEINPTKPTIAVTGSTHLRGPGLASLPENNTVVLTSSQEAELYYWYKNGSPINFPITDIDDTLRVATLTSGSTAASGLHTLVTVNSNCPSPPSDPVSLFFANAAPLNITGINSLGVDFKGAAMSPSSVLLSWNDKLNIETGYEIWRKKGAEPFRFVTKTAEDGISFLDTGLKPDTIYQYKLRAINNTGRSNYVPGDNVTTQNLIVVTPPDTQPPTAPQFLTATGNTFSSINLSWQPATDDGAIKTYYVYYNNDSISTGSTATNYTLSGLPGNTIFSITVKAVDFGNRFSPASNRIVSTTYVSGLSYKHSTGAWTDLDDPSMVASWTNPEFTGNINNFSLSPRTQDEFFNFEFNGYLYVPGGNYTFRLSSDDGSRLFIDGVQIVDHDGLHGTGTWKESSTIALSAGPHAIRVRYFEYTGGDGLTVQYRGTGIGNGSTWTTIPDIALKTGNYIPAPSPAPPVNLTATGTGMQRMDLAWQEGQTLNVNGLKIVILGSSTAFGTGATQPANSWVELLRSYLVGENINNRAQNGYDTRDIMATGTPSPATPVADRNITYALAQNPNLIIVNLPSNDVANNIPLSETMANYRAVKAAADAYGVRVLFTTTQPRNFNNNQSSKRLEQDIQGDSIRNAFGNDVIDIYDQLTDFSNDRRIKSMYMAANNDGIHVNDAGHQYIFTKVRDKVLEAIEEIHGDIFYEISRSQNNAGPFAMVGSSPTTTFVDSTGLQPGNVYYYKVRALNPGGGISDFSNVASDTTLSDPTPPTAPTNLQLISKTFTNAVFSWTASTDNIGVVGYDVFANGNLIGTCTVTSFTASNLSPNTTYTMTVKAVDGNGNRSAASAGLVVITNTPATFYSLADGNLNTEATWKQNPDGSGNSPVSFSQNGQYFVVSNRTTTSLGGSWNIGGTVSKVIVPDNVTLTVDNPFAARVEVQGTGTLNLNHTTAPEILSVSPASTVNFNGYGNIPKNTYGNVNLTGIGNKTFASDTVTILGNLTATDGIALKGAAGNTSTIKLHGNFNFTGSADLTAADNRLSLHFVKTGTQNLTTNGDLYLYRITTTPLTSVVVSNTGTPGIIRTGSLQGGGLSLPNGSLLNLGNNSLQLEHGATINPSNESGRIGVNGGDIVLTSTSGSNSNLYFSPANNTIDRLELNLSGGGDAIFRESARVSGAVKISRGELQSNGNITLLSNATQTANIETIENGGVITGKMSVQRYLDPKGRIWRYMSTAVDSTSIADWQAFFAITGDFTGTSTGTGLTRTPSMYYYDGALDDWAVYPPVGTSNQVLLEKGRGYSAFLRNGTSSITIQVAGHPHQGNVIFPLNGDNGNGTEDGWNLLGNPYASTIEWSNDPQAWIKSGINPVVSVRDNPSGQFRYYDLSSNQGNLAGGRIAPGQAFWVRAINATPSLTITERAKNNGQQIIYREEQASESLIVNLKQGSKIDPAFIILSGDGTDGFDNWADGTKRKNEGMFNLSTRADGRDLAVNHLSSDFCTKTVPLTIGEAPAGNYLLTFEKLETLTSVEAITLTDNFTGTVTQVTGADYAFSITSNAASTGATRFTLTFTRPALETNIAGTAVDVCGESVQTITLHDTQQGVEYALTNQTLQVISETVTGNGEDVTLKITSAHFTEGSNQFKIQAGFKGCTKQILPQEVTFNAVATPAVTTQQELSICQGSDLVLHASGAPAGGYYRWFDGDGNEIVQANASSLPLSNLKSERVYFVSAVTAGGCEGERKAIYIFPEALDTPEITFTNDTLFTTTNAWFQWKKDGANIEGANQFYFKPMVTGVYTLEVYNGGCVKESLPYEFLVTGREEGISQKSFSVSVYPVPSASDNLHIEIQSGVYEPVSLSLIDALGKPYYQGQLPATGIGDRIKITPASTLPDGIYFVVARQGRYSVKKKVLIVN